MATQATEKRGLFRLIADVPALIVQLFRDELESLKLEITKKVKGVAVGAALLAVAAAFAFLMLIMLLIAAVFALAQVVPAWAAALIVAGALLVIAVVLVLVGIGQFKRGDPGKVAESVKKDVNTIKGIGKRD
jgi:cytochrome c biogenesis protein CcdA